MKETVGCLWGPLYSGQILNSSTYQDAQRTSQGKQQIRLCKLCLWNRASGQELGCELFAQSSQVAPRQASDIEK